MKMKHLNKILASALSVSMLMGSALPVMAAEEGVDVNAPIYSLDVINVIVPTTYAVAFNPDGLPVKTGETPAAEEPGEPEAILSTDQILSKNYGIINKSSKDKLIVVSLSVADQNTDSGITFVDTKEEVESAADGEYKIHLTAIPAKTADVQVGSTPAAPDQTTVAADLSDVTMTKAEEEKAVTLKDGENLLGFKLDKAVWTPKEGADVTLGETTSNNVSENYEVTALAGEGAGVTAFTFGGEMNANADWFKLTEGIKITVVYDSITAASDLAAIDGTGAMVELNIAPTFTTGTGVGQIKYTKGAGNNALKEIKKIDMVYGTKTYDVYHASGTTWPAATDEAGVITVSTKALAIWSSSGSTVEATVTYETNGGDEKTAKVNIVREIVNAAPTFTTGSAVGQINYTPGAGNDGLKEITKIEMTYSSKVYDVYHASGTTWSDAKVASGVITIDSKAMAIWSNSADTVSATVSYVTNGGDTRTASLDVKCK